MRIAIIGPQGSGKSVLANELAEAANLPLIPEAARTVAPVWKISKDGSSLSPAFIFLWQISIIYEQMAAEINSKEVFVSDRSVIDNIAYLLLYYEKFPGYLHKNVVTHCMQRCRDNASNYTHIFYMPAVKEALVDDGFRNIDPEHQEMADNKIWEVIKLWDLQGTVIFVPSYLSWKEKHNFVFQALGML